MFEFYLWLMVSDRPEHHWEPIPFHEDDASDPTEHDRLREKVTLACEASGVGVHVLNFNMTHGGLAVCAGFARNHPLPEGTERRFLEQLASLAPTTYGVIYSLDTDQADARGEFNVLKLANQEIRQTKELLVPPKSETTRSAGVTARRDKP